MSKICIAFDVDGTLFDTKPGIIMAINYVREQYGRDKLTPDEEDKYIGPPIKKSLMEYSGLSEEEAVSGTKMYRREYVDKYVQFSNEYEGMEQLLKNLRAAGCITGVATMKTMPQVDKLLKIKDFEKYFDVVYGAAEDGSLSKAQMLLNIKNEYPGCSAYYMVGDTKGDYKAAVDAGYEFIAADYGYGEISDAEAALHIDKAMDIMKVVDE